MPPKLCYCDSISSNKHWYIRFHLHVQTLCSSYKDSKRCVIYSMYDTSEHIHLLVLLLIEAYFVCFLFVFKGIQTLPPLFSLFYPVLHLRLHLNGFSIQNVQHDENYQNHIYTHTHTHRAVSWIMIFNQLPFTAVIDNYMEHVVVSTCINGYYAQQGNYEIIIAWGLCISPKNARTYIRMFRFGGIEIEWILDFLFHQYAQKKIELKRIYTSFHWYPLLGWAKKCPI